MAAKAIYKYNFAIIKVATGGYIVHNQNKPFNQGHTHLCSFNAAISAVKLVHNKMLPKNKSEYFIESLCRIAEDKEYIETLQDLNPSIEDLMCHSTMDVWKCEGRC